MGTVPHNYATGLCTNGARGGWTAVTVMADGPGTRFGSSVAHFLGAVPGRSPEIAQR